MDSNLFRQSDVFEKDNKSKGPTGATGGGIEGAGDDIDSILQYL
jgi:hypothetical protein